MLIKGLGKTDLENMKKLKRSAQTTSLPVP